MIEIFDNIRKIYRFHTPCEELADYVEFFSESSSEETKNQMGNNSFEVKMFSSWTPTFWFNLGSPYQLKMDTVLHNVGKGNDILIIRNSPVTRVVQPTDHIFSIKFFPGGLEAILGFDQSVMQNQVINLKDILPGSLIQQARSLGSFEDRTALLQSFFLDQLIKKKKRDHYMYFVRETIACFENGQMHYNVNELSSRLFTTSKTINRYFNRVIGTSPKNYFNTLRARTALSAWVADKKTFAPDDFGYYDLSHFHKEINKFIGH